MADFFSRVGIVAPTDPAAAGQPGPDAGFQPPRPPNQPGVMGAPEGAPKGTVAPTPGMAPSTPPAPGAAPAVAGGVPTAPMVPQVQLPHIPRPHEITSYPGAQVNTPYGPVITDPRTGQAALHFTPEGRQAYAGAIVAMRRRMGASPVAGDPKAPQMQVIPGRVGFDPFSGRYFS